MKRNLLVLGIALAVFLAVYYVKHAYRIFRWDDKQTYFNHLSDEPLGMCLFDSIASQTATHSYRYMDVPFERIEKMKQPLSLLIVTDYMTINDSLLAVKLLDFVKKGNHVMMVTENLRSWEYPLKKVLKAETVTEKDLIADSLKLAFKRGETRLVSPVKDAPLPQSLSQYRVNPWLVNGFVQLYSHEWEQLLAAPFNLLEYTDDGTVEKTETNVVAAVRRMGKGQLCLVTTPYLFTNYAALHPQLCRYQHQLLSQLDDRPIVRLERLYLETDYSGEGLGESPLRYLLENEPLRWALYTALAALLLFMVFTARRRQRVIPYKAPPANHNLEFVRFMGSIYCQQHDGNDLLRKKYTYFCEELRRCQLIDLTGRNRSDEVIALLARTADVPVDEVRRVLTRIWVYVDGDDSPDNKTLCGCIDDMNYLLTRCRQTGR